MQKAKDAQNSHMLTKVQPVKGDEHNKEHSTTNDKNTGAVML